MLYGAFFDRNTGTLTLLLTTLSFVIWTNLGNSDSVSSSVTYFYKAEIRSLSSGWALFKALRSLVKASESFLKFLYNLLYCAWCSVISTSTATPGFAYSWISIICWVTWWIWGISTILSTIFYRRWGTSTILSV